MIFSVKFPAMDVGSMRYNCTYMRGKVIEREKMERVSEGRMIHMTKSARTPEAPKYGMVYTRVFSPTTTNGQQEKKSINKEDEDSDVRKIMKHERVS